MTRFGRVRALGAETADLSVVSWGGAAVGGQAAWVGPLSIAVLVAGIYVFTALGFEIMQSLPLVTSGESGGH